jgi:hypothetical protein
MSFGAGFNQGSAAVARGLAARAQREKLELAQQQASQKQLVDLIDFKVKNPNVKLPVIARLPRFQGLPPERIEEADELAKVLINAEKQRTETAAASAATAESAKSTFGPLIQTAQGLPGPLALQGATVTTPQQGLEFSQNLSRIGALPPEARGPLLGQLGAQIGAVPFTPALRQISEQEDAREREKGEAKLRGELEVSEPFERRKEQRQEKLLRERPDTKFRRIQQNVDADIMTPEEGNAARRAVVRLDSIGAAANAEALRQGFELSSTEQQIMGTIGDLSVTNEMLALATSLPPETLRKFTGISGRAFRLASGVTAGVVDFTEVFGDDKPRVDAWMQEQLAVGPLEAEDTGGGFFTDTPREEIRKSIRFLEDRQALGTFDAYILASQIALARANTRGGRITRVALDQAKEQIDPNRFSDSDAVLSAFDGAKKAIAVRSRVLERQMRVTQGARISPAIQGVREAASALSESPGSVPTTLSPERQQEEDREIADELRRESERGLAKEHKETLRLFDEDMKRIEGEQPRALRDAAGANLPRRVVRDRRTGEPVSGTGAAIGLPAGTRR